MKFRLPVIMAVGALCVVATGCEKSGSEVVESSVSLTYDITETGCATGKHSFSSRAEYCAGLQDSGLNRGCAEYSRRRFFTQRCSGSFRSNAGGSTFSTPSTGTAAGTVSFWRTLKCTTQAMKKIVIEGYRPDKDLYTERKAEIQYGVFPGQKVDLWAGLRNMVSDENEKELGTATAEISADELTVRSELAVIGTRADATSKLGELLTIHNEDKASGRILTVECRLSVSSD